MNKISTRGFVMFMGILCFVLIAPKDLRSISRDSIFAEIQGEKKALIELIRNWEEKYNVLFTYDRRIVESIKVEVPDTEMGEIDKALDYVLEKTELKYTILENRYVILYKNDIEGIKSLKKMVEHLSKIVVNENKKFADRKAKTIDLLHTHTPLDLYQKRMVMNISGTVTNESGETLIGVNVLVKGTNKGTATDFEGHFNLEDVDENAVLVVSYIGYQTLEVPVAGKSTFTITLKMDSQLLDEVVVVGYGTQKKVNLTGAVDQVTKKSLANRQSSNLSQLLQGASPALNFSVNNSGFQPGAEMDISIRGIGSLNGGRPYVIIDGFPGSINNLNPDDVETISILKDAASSAIYGARAPYGVILITTKQGKKDEKLKVNYSGNVFLKTPGQLPEMLDSYTFARVMNEAGRNQGGIQFPESKIDQILAFQNEDWDYLERTIGSIFHENASVRYGAYPDGQNWNTNVQNYANNDWWDLYYGNSFNQKHDLTISGGSKDITYYFSAGYLTENSVLNYGKDVFNRINVMGKLKYMINDWWSISYETRLANKHREKPYLVGRSSEYSDMFTEIGRIFPTTPIYDGFGNYNYESHIPKILTNKGNDNQIDYWNNFKMELYPIRNLLIHGDFAYNTFSRLNTILRPYMYTYLVDNTKIINNISVPNSIQRLNNRDYYWTANIYSSYDWEINVNNKLGVLAGVQIEKGEYVLLDAKKSDIIVDEIPSFQTATGAVTLSEDLSHMATQGYFSRITYNHKEKYLFESNLRYDGSYVFRQGNRWGLYPSFSAGWNVYKEGFWSSLENHINILKFRGSWGQLGNQNISPYSDLELLPLNTSQLFWVPNYGGTRPIGYTSTPAIVNKNLTWETVTTKNFGVDMAFFNHKLSTTLDLFERLTTDMIGPTEAKPGVLGASVPRDNNASLRTRGWEIGIKWKQVFDNGFSYFINGNLYDYKSKVTKYYNPTGTISTWYEGKEVGEIWGYTVNELFRTQEELDIYLESVDLSHLGSTWRTGDVKYEDINNDGKVDNGNNSISNHGDLSIIGNSEARYHYGITAGFEYKNFDFSMLWNGVAKRDQWFDVYSNLFWGFAQGQRWAVNINPNVLDYFRDEPGTKEFGLYEGDANINLDAYFPRPYLNGTQQRKNIDNPSTRYLQDASFLRLQNVQLGYSLPQNLISKLRFQNFRIYFSGENIFTFDKLPEGMDPIALRGNNPYRTGGGGRLTYIADRVFSFGANIVF